jgi:hypothetical protein
MNVMSFSAAKTIFLLIKIFVLTSAISATQELSKKTKYKLFVLFTANHSSIDTTKLNSQPKLDQNPGLLLYETV